MKIDNFKDIHRAAANIALRDAMTTITNPSEFGQMQTAILMAFTAGMAEGIRTYAHWDGGAQYVGTCGRTLADAIADIASNTENIMSHDHVCADCGNEQSEAPTGTANICSQCSGLRVIMISEAERMFGPDWRDAFKGQKSERG